MVIVKCDGCGREVRVIADAQQTEVMHEAPECEHFKKKLAQISKSMFGRPPDVSRMKIVK